MFGFSRTRPVATTADDSFREEDATRIVQALYRTLLMREPDAEGCAHFVTGLTSGTMTVDQVVQGLLRSHEFFLRRGQFIDQYQADQRDSFFAEVSQFGEVSELIRAMTNVACHTAIVVDVGVHRREGSNSYDLMRWLGWRGLLIEANAGLNDQINREFAGLDYRMVNVAVSDYVGTAQFHIGNTDGVSSLHADHARQFGPTVTTLTVPVDRLPLILKRENIPLRFGLLSIDIEGEDITVLNDLIRRSDYRPDWIIFEHALSGDYHPGALPLVTDFDAAYVTAGRTPHNLIFRNRTLPAR